MKLEQITDWYFSRKALPYWCVLLFDCGIVFFSGFVAFIIDRRGLSANQFWPLIDTLLFYLLFFVLGFRLTRTYSGVLRYSSFSDLFRIGIANAIGAGCIIIVRHLFHADEWTFFDGHHLLPLNSMTVLTMVILSIVIMMSSRILVKFLHDHSGDSSRTRGAFIYGVKQGGIAIAKYLNVTTPARFHLRGFVSDADDIQDHMLMGVNIYHNDEDLPDNMVRKGASVLLVSPLKADRLVQNQDMVNRLLASGITIYTLDNARKWDGSTKPESLQMREVQIEDLLPRAQIQVNLDEIGNLLRDKVVLITGSAGSIGSEIVRQIATFGPARMVLIDAAETPQHDIRLMMQNTYPYVKADIIVTSITNSVRMQKIFEELRPDYVFHAAAYKHVPMMEDNPSEAVFNNIHGTRIVADLSACYGVKKFVMISTDKAVNPTNVMGCSKRICEIYVQSLDKYLKAHPDKGVTQFVTTRFGNVLGSNGSVVPLFREQIKKGGPITVTHPDIIRFFMLIPEACKLVLEAGTMGHGGEIYVFDMGEPVKIADLARRMILLSGAKDVEIKFTGLRDGEKLYEEVLNEKEVTLPTDNKKIQIAQVREYDYEEVTKDIDRLFAQSKELDDMATVRIMKEIVPEYKSQHSKYEVLDRGGQLTDYKYFKK